MRFINIQVASSSRYEFNKGGSEIKWSMCGGTWDGVLDGLLQFTDAFLHSLHHQEGWVLRRLLLAARQVPAYAVLVIFLRYIPARYLPNF